ncbi:MAG TPA: class I SAM-dependent methyltransferase [Pseudonocardiaceae bacterium]
MDGTSTRAMVEIRAWLRLAPLLTEYLPFPEGSLSAPALTAVLDEVLLGQRTVLLELGSGPSSILLARVLARRGFGRLLTIEHDERRAAYVDMQLRHEGLQQIAQVAHVPLAAHPAALNDLPWYAPKQIRDEVTRYVERVGLVDLLLVDGPTLPETAAPARENGARPTKPRPCGALLRYPALPVLRGALAPEAVVLVDDADRPEDMTLLRRWGEEFTMRFRVDATTRLARAALTPP